ncbi:MAG: hypothetical protein R2757_22595 [Draconibacterium sp.]
MKISTIRASKLRNDEHFQFQTEFKTLVEQHTPETLVFKKRMASL